MDKTVELPDDKAIEVIKSAGFKVNKSPVIVILPFVIKLGKTRSSVVLCCKAVAKAIYVFELSTDGINFQIAKITTTRIASIDALKDGNYYFRFKTINNDFESQYSETLKWRVE